MSNISIARETFKKQKKMLPKKGTDIRKFDDEIILNILSNLRDPRDLCMASTLAPNWKRVSQDPALWSTKGKLEHFFGVEGELDFWKAICKLPY